MLSQLYTGDNITQAETWCLLDPGLSVPATFKFQMMQNKCSPMQQQCEFTTQKKGGTKIVKQPLLSLCHLKHITETVKQKYTFDKS